MMEKLGGSCSNAGDHRLVTFQVGSFIQSEESVVCAVRRSTMEKNCIFSGHLLLRSY